MTSLGDYIASGRTSEVHAFGTSSVVKILHPDVPAEWARYEADLTRTIFAMGAPVPEVRDLITIENRPAVVFERIVGPSMWQQMLDNPSTASRLAQELAAVQKDLSSLGMPQGVPDFVNRLQSKIRLAKGISEIDRASARAMLEELPRGAALMHGDMHPGNVLLGSRGPIVIDWFDAAIGHPVADIVRSSLLIRPGATTPKHLPGASSDLLTAVHRSYLDSMQPELEAAAEQLPRWQAVLAVGRLSERAEVDESGLIALWETRAAADAGHQLVP